MNRELIIMVIRLLGMILCSLAAIGYSHEEKYFKAAIWIAIAFLFKN